MSTSEPTEPTVASERPPLDEIINRAEAVRPELETLGGLAAIVYDELRPLARHVSEHPHDYPLQHQQVHGMSPDMKIGGVVSDYLIIRSGEDHSLVLYRNLYADPLDGHGFTWRLTRNSPLEHWHYQQTVVLIYESSGQHGLGTYKGRHGIEITKMKHGAKRGLNVSCQGIIDPYLDETQKYIDEFTADLEQARRSFSGC